MSGQIIRLQTDHLTWRRVDESILVFDLNHSTYLSVNGTGLVIWPYLIAGTTLDALVELLLETFDVSEDVARRDVRLFVDTLRSRLFLH
jgi:hypothetical protein